MDKVELSDNPNILSEALEAYQTLDRERFSAAITQLDLPQPWQPGDCITLVDTFTAVIYGEPEYQKVCQSKQAILTTEQRMEAIRAVINGETAAQLFDTLEALGLLVCTWVPVRSNDKLIIGSITRTLCPGSKPTPGPDPIP